MPKEDTKSILDLNRPNSTRNAQTARNDIRASGTVVKNNNVKWETATLELRLLSQDDIKKLNDLAIQLETFVNTLDTVKKAARTLLNPIIALLRTIEDPFAGLIAQLIQQVEQLKQLFENQGFYMLETFTDTFSAANNSQQTALDYADNSQDNRSWTANRNKILLEAQRVEEERRREKYNTTKKNDPKSPNKPDDDKPLSQSQINQLKKEAVKIQQLYETIENYHTIVITSFEEAITFYDDLNRASTKIKPQANLQYHYLGKVKNKEKVVGREPTPGNNKVYINIPKVSDMADTFTGGLYLTASDSLFKQLVDNHVFVEWGGTPTQTTNVNHLGISKIAGVADKDISSVSGARRSADVSSQFLNITSKKDIIQNVVDLADRIDKIYKKYKTKISPSDLKNKEIDLYREIESTLKTQSQEAATNDLLNQSLVSDINTTTAIKHSFKEVKDVKKEGASKSIETTYLKVINDAIAKSNDSAERNVLTSLKYSNTSVYDTQVGFQYDRTILKEAKSKAEMIRDAELKTISNIRDYINVEIEHSGNISSNLEIDSTPKNSYSIIPPRRTANELKSETDKDSVSPNKKEVAIQTAIALSIESQLNNLDNAENKQEAISSYYKRLLPVLSKEIGNQFSAMQSAYNSIRSTAGQAGSTANYGNIMRQLKIDFGGLFDAMIRLKSIFNVLNVKKQSLKTYANESILGNTDAEKKKIEKLLIDFETFCIELVTLQLNASDVIRVLNDFTAFTREVTYVSVKDYVDGYLAAVKEIFTGGQIQVADVSDLTLNPFELFFEGIDGESTAYENLFVGGNTNANIDDSSINDVIEFVTFFSDIDTIMFDQSVPQPSEYFATAAGGAGIDKIILLLRRQINEVEKGNINDFKELKSTVLGELGQAQKTLECTDKAYGTGKVPDAAKKAINDASRELKEEINILSAEIKRKQKELFDLISKGNLTQDSIKKINRLVNEVGGFEIDINGNQVGGTVNGSLNNRIIQRQIRLNQLNIDSLDIDQTNADLEGDRSLRSRTSVRLSVINQELALIDSKTAEIDDDGFFLESAEKQRGLLDSQKKLLEDEKKSLEGILEKIINNVTADVSNEFVKIIDIQNEVGNSIRTIEAKIEEIASNSVFNDNPDLVKAIIDGVGDAMDIKDIPTLTVSLPYYTYNDNFAVNDRNEGTNFEVIQQLASMSSLLLNIDQGLIENTLSESDIDFRTRTDYSVLIESKQDNVEAEKNLTTGYKGGVVTYEGPYDRFMLPLGLRLQELYKVKDRARQKLEQSVRETQNNPKRQSNDTNKTTLERNFIKSTTKNKWIDEIVASLKDTRDLRRPIFMDDLPTGQPVNALFGTAAQTQLDKALEYGEMAVVVFAFVSTDINGLIKDATNAYEMFVKPEKFRERLTKYKFRADKIFSNIAAIGKSITDVLEDPELFFEQEIALPVENAMDKIQRAFNAANAGDKECFERETLINPVTTDRIDKWKSIRLADIIFVSYIFDWLDDIIALLSNVWLPQIGLADLLEQLLKSIEEKIELLKNISSAIGLLIEFIEFVGGLKFTPTALVVRKVRSINEIEVGLRTGKDWPAPFYAQGPDDPVFIASVVFAMPDYFYDAAFKKLFPTAGSDVNHLTDVDALNAYIEKSLGRTGSDPDVVFDNTITIENNGVTQFI